MRKIGFWALLAATVLSGAVMAGCGGHVREPVTLSDQRFNGVFVITEYINGTAGKTDRWEYDGTSKCYRADEFHDNSTGTQEFEVDKKNQRYRFRWWDDDAEWEYEWNDWSDYRFSEDGSVYWYLPPDKLAAWITANDVPSVITSEIRDIWEQAWGKGYVKQ
ncbi:MAG: hypothetical protein FWD94_03710 [Treponema sp.]|nr:hypothetical protein [Treponema sp.]